jgi:xanthine/CO dehydrogenase XdhC/CoxF family maturation factor
MARAQRITTISLMLWRKLVICEDGKMAGSVSGGCVENAVSAAELAGGSGTTTSINSCGHARQMHEVGTTARQLWTGARRALER